MFVRYLSDRIWSHGAEGSGAVVSESQSASADAGREDLAADQSGAGEESGTEEADERSQNQNQPLHAGGGIKGNEHRGTQGEQHQRALSSQAVGDPAKAQVAGKHSHKIQSHQQLSGAHHAQTASSIFHG